MKFRRATVRVSPEVFALAIAAYDYVREMEHPLPDFSMRQNTRRSLHQAVDALPYDDLKRLFEGRP
jgi:hypothetical protein